MDNKRVYEVAKELGMPNKDLLDFLSEKMGLTNKSHSSMLTSEQITKIKATLFPKQDDSPKKPKAYIIKKAKHVEDKQSTNSENTISDIHDNLKETKNKVETHTVINNSVKITQTDIEKENTKIVSENESANKDESSVNNEQNNNSNVPIRSLLAYNNQNSQRKRAEIEAKKQQREREQRIQQNNSKDSKFKIQSKDGKSFGQKPFAKNEDGKPFNKNSQQSAVNRPFPKKDGNNQSQNSDRKPIQRHIISQDIYEGKTNVNNSKRKNVKDKKKQYKNKEEEQELISLEKAISQKHKKKSKDDIGEDKITSVVINQLISVGDLAQKIHISPAEIVKFLMMEGILTTVNQIIDIPTQKKICANFEIEALEEDIDAYIEKELEKEEKQKAFEQIDESLLELRAPVISIMGHVDHGKTTLLDSIRASKHKIVSTEVGGITQSIGAYTVYSDNKKIVFIDTPGHEAFTEMRARGAKATDIAILVVAADDGIMPQTIEAINHAKAAEIPIIVAVNKIDKPAANPDKVLQQLTEYGLVPEEWGGDTICVKVSALQGTGIDELLEYISILAEVKNLRANPSALASGVIIEANLDKGKGPVATLLVQNGTLKIGNCFVVGSACGKVRALGADSGERVSEAGPSTPVEILGLEEVPQAGDTFEVVENEKIMHSICAERKEKERNTRLETIMPAHIKNEVVGSGENDIKHLNIIIKANTNGSAEAVSQGISQLESKEIQTKIIHVGVGDISEADVMLASASNAIILGFTVRDDANAQAAAEKYGVTIKKYNIIYQVLEDLEKTMLGLLQPEIKEVELGTAEVRQVFTVGKTSKIAGCYVTDGKIIRNKTATVIRNGEEVFKGQIDQLKRFKDDVKEVAQGFECGISFDKFNDILVGDIINVSGTEEIERQVLV